MTADLWSEDSGNMKSSGMPQERTASSYLQEAKIHIRRDNLHEAYCILQAAHVMYPDNPFILSYYGSLHAVIGKKHRAGIEHCTRAITLIVNRSPVGEYLILSEFCLNLGRACLAAGMRQDAIRALHKGLKYDKNNTALLKELRACERRSRPTVPFLDRANPINKFSGLVLRRCSPRKG
jgi:hypothetical protein